MEEALLSAPVNTYTDFVDFEPEIGDDVFVLGFPLGTDGGDRVALWKRGSIASLPQSDIAGLPKVLIDTATRKGMSGAPVVVRRSGVIVPRGSKSDGSALSGNEIIGKADTLLGIYSSRLGKDEMGAQLGIVWKSKVIDEIILGDKLGSSIY